MSMDPLYTDALKELEEVKAQRDEYRDHLALIAEMTGNKGDIGAAHEGVNAVIEECAARLKRVDFLNQQNTALQEQIDALAAHVERLKEAASIPRLESWMRILEIINDSPATSLARRDALKKAEGLRLAADFIEQKATDYDAEHGSTDPSTGHREYPGDGAEYYNEMMELADDLRQQAEGFQ